MFSIIYIGAYRSADQTRFSSDASSSSVCTRARAHTHNARNHIAIFVLLTGIRPVVVVSRRQMHGPRASAVTAACALLLLLAVTTPVAQAAVSPARRRHERPARPGPVAADQPVDNNRPVAAAAATADEYDDANYDELQPDYEDNGNYHRPLPDTNAGDNGRTINI